MSKISTEIQKIEQNINEFDRKIEELHRKIRLHLLDKKKYPLPNYQFEIAKITEYQITDIRNKVLDILLDNIKFKARLRSRVWRRWLDEDTKKTLDNGQLSIDKKNME